MAETQWNDKLRQAMADYSQTPPEGLWDAIDAKVHRKAAPVFPWWWALAGAAAAVAAVLLLWPRPMVEPDVNQNIAEVVTPADTLAEPAPEQDAVLQDAPQEKAPVALAPTRPLIARAKADAPQGTEQSAQLDSGEITDPAVQPDSEGDKSTRPEKDAKTDTTPKPDTDVKEAVKPDAGQQDIQIIYENIDHKSPATKPLLAQLQRPSLSIVGAGVPGGPATSTITEYAMSAVAGTNGSRASASPMTAILSRNKSTTTTADHAMTFRAGLMLDLPVSRHFALESGLLMTVLSSVFTSRTGTAETESLKNMRYVGIPLNLVYTPFSTRHFSCYLSAGPMAECAVRTDWKSFGKIGNTTTGHDSGVERINEWIWSLGANAGVQWHPYSKGAFFLQPGLSWHIPKEGQQESLYTAQPLSPTISAGYRVIF